MVTIGGIHEMFSSKKKTKKKKVYFFQKEDVGYTL